MFHQDAETAAPILNIALTMRNKKAADETKMCGLPHHSIAGPVSKLLAAGLKVAICDQMEPAHLAKGLVRREVTRILTPGMVYDPESLDQLQSNYLCAFDRDFISFLDISTGEAFYYRTPGGVPDQKQLMALTNPVEVVLTPQQKEHFQEGFKGFHISVFPDSPSGDNNNTPPAAGFKNLSLFPDRPPCTLRLLNYVKSQQGEKALQILKGGGFKERFWDQEMHISRQSQSHLELFETSTGEKKGSLFAAMDRTRTAAGARLLKSRLLAPCINKKVLQHRLDQVEYWIQQPGKLSLIRGHLSQVGDLQRRLSRVIHPHFTPLDLLTLARSVEAGIKILPFLPRPFPPSGRESLHRLTTRITNTFSPTLTEKGGSLDIRKGISGELDLLLQEKHKIQAGLQKLQTLERDKTQIPSLKIRYNHVFGYYIEVTKSHFSKVPSHYIRRQTLTQAERYTTADLQDRESRMLRVVERVKACEGQVFESLKQEVEAHFADLFSLCRMLSETDVDGALAYLALERNYTRPRFSETKQLVLENSRHPVVEQQAGSLFVPNTIRMKQGECLLLTGPNMAGKSTLMRQVALSVIMAQVGSFVPATQALLPLFNKLFTRIGASDSLSEGLSTFMVEMKEAAHILNRADPHSLVILDEMGRGTATYDGMSLAQSLLEYLLKHKKSLTFFATHYHELTQIPLPEIRNAHLSVKDNQGVIEFLYHLKPGPAQRSYGIHVARLAGFPQEVLHRASELLQKREQKTSPSLPKETKTADPSPEGPQNSDPKTRPPTPLLRQNLDLELLLQQIRSYPLQSKSPLETMNVVAGWKQEINKKS